MEITKGISTQIKNRKQMSKQTAVINDEIKVYLVHHKQEIEHFKNSGNKQLMNYHIGIVFFIENVLKIKL